MRSAAEQWRPCRDEPAARTLGHAVPETRPPPNPVPLGLIMELRDYCMSQCTSPRGREGDFTHRGVGASLDGLTEHGAMAQLVARLVRNEKVRGSNPLSSTEVSVRFLLPRRTPGGPRARIQQGQTRAIRRRSQKMQIPIRRPDRLMTAPRLHRSRVHTPRQPQTRSRMPQIVNPTALTGPRPVHRSHQGSPPQLPTLSTGEQQLIRALVSRERLHQRQYPISQRNPTGLIGLGRFHCTTLGLGTGDPQTGGGDPLQRRYLHGPELSPPEPRPSSDQHHGCKPFIQLTRRRENRFQFILGEWSCRLRGRPIRNHPRHLHPRHRIRRRIPLTNCP